MTTKNKQLIAVALLGCFATETHAITLVNPSFYGQPNTTSQTWNNSFTIPAGPNAPSSASNSAGTANYSDRTAATDGAFITGGHIYSFSGVVDPKIDIPLPNIGTIGATSIVLQAQVLGSPLDQATFLATAGSNSFAPSNVALTSSGSGMGAEEVYVVTWNSLPIATAYSLTYTPNAVSSSQAITRVDTLSAVPEPASLTLLGLGGASALLKRRRAASL